MTPASRARISISAVWSEIEYGKLLFQIPAEFSVLKSRIFDFQAIKYAAVKTWNETPNEIRASMSIKAFMKNTFGLPPKPILDICLHSSGQDSPKQYSI